MIACWSCNEKKMINVAFNCLQHVTIAKVLDYLDYTLFLRLGLIEQLVFESFTTEEVEYAVGKVDY